jgi:hypothetical protein
VILEFRSGDLSKTFNIITRSILVIIAVNRHFSIFCTLPNISLCKKGDSNGWLDSKGKTQPETRCPAISKQH